MCLPTWKRGTLFIIDTWYYDVSELSTDSVKKCCGLMCHGTLAINTDYYKYLYLEVSFWFPYGESDY